MLEKLEGVKRFKSLLGLFVSDEEKTFYGIETSWSLTRWWASELWSI